MNWAVLNYFCLPQNTYYWRIPSTFLNFAIFSLDNIPGTLLCFWCGLQQFSGCFQSWHILHVACCTSNCHYTSIHSTLQHIVVFWLGSFHSILQHITVFWQVLVYWLYSHQCEFEEILCILITWSTFTKWTKFDANAVMCAT